MDMIVEAGNCNKAGSLPQEGVSLGGRLPRASWASVDHSSIKHGWLVILLILILVLTPIILLLSRQRPPPELEVMVIPTPPIELDPGDGINLEIDVHNHRGRSKAKEVGGNVTFPEGFTPKILELFYGTISGGDGGGHGGYVFAPSQSGNYTATITIWGTNIEPHAYHFLVKVAPSE